MNYFRRLPVALLLTGGLLFSAALSGCTATNSGLPEGLPGSVSVVSGEVSNAVEGAANNWSFTVTVADANAQKEALTKLIDGGFSEIGSSENGDSTTHSLVDEKAGINATVVLGRQGEKFVVIYNLIKV